MIEGADVVNDLTPDEITHPQPLSKASAKPQMEKDDKSSDEETGASPGTAQACSDLGLNSLTANLEKFGIKPPGKS